MRAAILQTGMSPFAPVALKRIRVKNVAREARENADDEWIPFPLDIKLWPFSLPEIASSATAAAHLSVSGPHCSTVALMAT